MRQLSLAHRSGLFISLEGIDGCGKSTQAMLLRDHLEERGCSVVLTKEPGDWSHGGEIRRILLGGDLRHEHTELFLFMADRCEHLLQVVIPALDRGDIVICDRYTDSTLAYQCFGRGLDLTFVEGLFNWSKFPVPDVTLWIDVPLSCSLGRISSRGSLDRMEEDSVFLDRVLFGFQSLRESYEDRIIRIDGEGEENVVFSRLMESLEGLIPWQL